MSKNLENKKIIQEEIIKLEKEIKILKQIIRENEIIDKSEKKFEMQKKWQSRGGITNVWLFLAFGLIALGGIIYFASSIF